MTSIFQNRAFTGNLTRRDFVKLSALAAVSTAVTGCAANPVTGQSQLMFMNEQDEIRLDHANAPHQFSADYGISPDKALGHYVSTVGNSLAAASHRPQMPYSFNVVNATYVNAYAFPGGSIAITRGILAELESEAELAALIGHELGHVNARHTAARMSKGKLLSGILGGASILAEATAGLGQLTGSIGGLGTQLLLASYSRDDERQADELGMAYMTKAQLPPQGMIELMAMLRSLHKQEPNALQIMFATHPMSEERYQTAVHRAEVQYTAQKNFPAHRERYMDNTARLRWLAPMFKAFQEGERAMSAKNYIEAATKYAQGLKHAPLDYAGLVMMSKCQIAQKNPQAARKFAAKAKKAYPSEAQAWHMHGIACMMSNNYSAALEDFITYEKTLPGNPTTIFMQGFAYEGMRNTQNAANAYQRYLRQVRQGEMAQHAHARLKAWGYL